MQPNNHTIYSHPTWQKWIALAVALLLLSIYWPGNYYFLNDDLLHIPLAGKGIIGHTNSVRYTGDLSLIIDYWLWGKNAAGYHLTNLILHIINSVLFYFIIQNVIRYLKWNTSENLAIFSAVLFALFGMHSDAIFWIIGRSASLGCLFFLLTILAFIKKNNGLWITPLGLTTWTLALFAYESVWILPFVLIGLEYSSSKQIKKIKFRPGFFNVAVIVIGILYLILRKINTHEILGDYEAGAIKGFEIITLFTNYAKLVLRTLIPPISAPAPFLYSFILFIPLYAWAIISLYRNHKTTLLALHGLWLFSYIPYISLGIGLNSIESERFLYLPSLFFAVCFCYTVIHSFQKTSLKYIIIISFIALHCCYLYSVSGIYANAGQAVKISYALLHQTKGKAVTIEQLPKTIGGVPTFRSGFTEGYQWLVQKDENEKPNIIVQDSAIFGYELITPALQQMDSLHTTLIFDSVLKNK